jgi:hypothetical protein
MTTNDDLTRLFGDRIRLETRMQKLRRLRLLILRDLIAWLIGRHQGRIRRLERCRTDVLEKLNGLDERGGGMGW